MSDAESGLSEDETEILVYVECEGYVDSNTFKNENLSFDIVGIDSEHPIMQINGKFYEGTYRDAVGTYMFFDKDDSAVVEDPVFDTIPTLKYLSKTRKLLKMERVFAMPKTEVLGDLDHTYCIPNMDTIKEAGVPPRYQDDALRFWTEMRDVRMQALTTYLEKQQIKEEKRLQGIEVDSESDEDNPFAMYKPKENKDAKFVPRSSESKTTDSLTTDDVVETEDSEISNILNRIMELDPTIDAAKKTLRKPVKKLTVIDPGPSTSKHNDSDMPSLSSKRKRKPTVRVPSKAKSKDVFKKPNKRAPKSKKSLKIPPYDQYLDDNVQINPLEAQTELKQNESDAPEPEVAENQESGGENSLASVDEETNSSLKTVCLITKKLEKQAKREAKMREISERLKTQKVERTIQKDTKIPENDTSEDSKTNNE